MQRAPSNNATAADEVPARNQTVFDKLNGLANDEQEAAGVVRAVPIWRPVTDEYIVCLEDGKRLKMLKRHLMTAYSMTSEEYRAK